MARKPKLASHAAVAASESSLGSARFHAESCERTLKVIDDERTAFGATLVALVEAASDTRLRTHCAFQCTGGGHAPDCPTVALLAALEAARVALKKAKR